MKKFRILMGALALAMVAATIVGCKKEKETNVAKQATGTEEVVRKPIATYDNATGKMAYYLTVGMIQESFEQSSFSKDGDRFIVEAFEIVPLGSDNDERGIRFSIIDTESEKSYTAFFGFDFLEEENFNDSIVYYIANDVESGNFIFTNFFREGAYTITISNFNVVGVEAIPDSLICTAPRPKKTVTCESQGCVSDGCSLYYDAYGNPSGCTECGATQSQTVYCRKTETGGGGGSGIDWVGIAVNLFLWVLSHGII